MEKNLTFFRKLPIPKEIKAEFPLSEHLAAVRQKQLDEMRDIFEGRSDRLMLVSGPCSADNEKSVLDYIYRLRRVP